MGTFYIQIFTKNWVKVVRNADRNFFMSLKKVVDFTGSEFYEIRGRSAYFFLYLLHRMLS